MTHIKYFLIIKEIIQCDYLSIRFSWGDTKDVYEIKPEKTVSPLLYHRNWHRIELSLGINFQSSFFARLYLRTDKQSNEVNAAVIAFRGTMPLAHPTNDISDFKMAILRQLPISYHSALVFFYGEKELKLAATLDSDGSSISSSLADQSFAFYEDNKGLMKQHAIASMPA